MVPAFFGCGGYLIALGWWYGRPEMVLQERGVLFEGGRYQVYCPWALFTAPGTPFLRHRLTKMVVLPMAAEFVPLIEIRCDGHPLGHDSLRKVRDLIRLNRSDTITLFGSYPNEVGQLLLQLGPALAQPLTPQAIHQAPVEPLPTALQRAGDWVTVNLTQLTFPPVCCRCLTPIEATKTWNLSPPTDWRSVLTHTHQFLEVNLPICGSCSAADHRRVRDSTLIGALLGTGVCLFLAGCTGVFFLGGLIGGLVMILGGAILGSAVGLGVSERPPVSVAKYSLGKQCVSLRFRNRAFTDLYLEHLGGVPERE
jgi:hypothetical protein